MINSYGLELLMREREIELRRAMKLKSLKSPRKAKGGKTPLGRALSLSVAFAAGWLIASIF
jgi:hypothetical protein